MNPVYWAALLQFPGGAPEPFRLNSWDENGIALSGPASPLRGGIEGQIGLKPFNDGTAFLRVQAHGWMYEYDGFRPLQATTIEAGIEPGWRWGSCTQNGIGCWYWDGSVGPRLYWLGISDWDDVLVAGISSHSGLNASIGSPNVRLLIGAELGLGLGWSRWTGELKAAGGSYQWYWPAGGLDAMLQAGVEFR